MLLVGPDGGPKILDKREIKLSELIGAADEINGFGFSARRRHEPKIIHG